MSNTSTNTNYDNPEAKSYPTEIYHVATAEDWDAWFEQETYQPAAFEREGFIHCCTEEQLPGVLERYFRGKTGLKKLYIDAKRLHAPLKWEIAASTGEYFPHVYGPINRSAIVGMKVLPKQPDPPSTT